MLWTLFIGRRFCSELSGIPKASTSSSLSVIPDLLSNESVKIVNEQSETTLLRRFRDTKPELPVHSYSLAPYVNNSETLKSFLALGVDFSRIEKVPKAAELLLKKDFRKDIDPYLLFIRTSGVGDDCIGQVVNRFPLIFAEDLDVLKSRVSFLASYGFSRPSIGRIITSAPSVLSRYVGDIDKTLDFVKEQFSLSPVQTNMVVTKCPRLLIFDDEKLKFNKLSLKDVAGFCDTELTAMMLTSPRIFTGSKQHMLGVFDYLHHVMDIKRGQIVQFPQIFRTRLRRIEQRHQFLLSLNRNQYNPKLPNFVPLFNLVTGSDQEFAENVAKSSIDKFNMFLKTL